MKKKTKKEFKFWTKLEDRLVEKAYSNSISMSEAAKSLVGVLTDRNLGSIQQRLSTRFGKKGVRGAKTTTKGIELPEGFTFELKNIKSASLLPDKSILIKF